jgi:hypothetical protein
MPPPAPPSLDLKQVCAALGKTTEALARELAQPGAVMPSWSDFEWQVARAVCAIHGISGLLASQLRWSGPAHWQAFLSNQRLQVAERMPRIQSLLQQIDLSTARQGIHVIALKGAALHAMGLYQPGDRPMADIDLLAPEQDIEGLADILGRLGYRETFSTWKHRVYRPVAAAVTQARFGERSTVEIKIEVHTAVREALPVRIVDLSNAVFGARARPGLNGYPSVAAALLHVLLHAAGATAFREVRALHLEDISRLCSRMSPADWQDLLLLAEREDERGMWWAYPPLVLASRYYGCVPAQVLEHAAQACLERLRRWYRSRSLTEVSLSYLWISAFPGLEWAGSAREMTQYVARRILPSGETLALRQEFALSQPRVSGGEWSQLSQLQRVLRWLVARQPRYATLQTVRESMSLGL